MIFASDQNCWLSRKGQQRQQNCDVGGIHYAEHYTLAIIVDAAEQRGAGQIYARYWVKAVLKAVQPLAKLKATTLQALLQKIHEQQREQGFLSEVAAFAILTVENGGQCWALSSGDCRIGALHKNQTITWLNPVHTAANINQEFQQAHAALDTRHLLTKRLHVRRWDKPEYIVLPERQGTDWVLATDGYWVDVLLLGKQAGELDDASLLIVRDRHSLAFTPTENFIIQVTETHRVRGHTQTKPPPNPK